MGGGSKRLFAMPNWSGSEILVLEDEVLLRKRLTAFLEKQGGHVSAAGKVSEARRLAEEFSFDFALLDVNLPDGSGLDLLEKNTLPTTCLTIVMTADGHIDGAVNAMRLGAVDYLVKPFDCGQIPLVFNRARHLRDAERREEHRRQREEPAADAFFFGKSLGDLKAVLEKILAADRRMEGTPPPILLEGETGTGKTTLARWIHYRGPRAGGPLIEVNCSALPESLAEAELFGHERGAFTDARKERIGLFEAASGGTLFLDEIASLSLPLQAKVLTAVEDRLIRRLGGNKTIAVDARLIAAANCDLRELAASGRFREDLYHRLDLYRLRLPPLRERVADLEKMAVAMLEKIAARHRREGMALTAEGRRKLTAYSWPGNVRELLHVLERAVVFEDGGIDLVSLPGDGQTENPALLTDGFRFPDSGFSLEDEIDRILRLALRQADGNVSAAARLLGVSRDYVRYRLKGKSGGKSESDGN